MISDLYPTGERASAMAIWAAGINAGIFLAFVFGGFVAQRWGWRIAFVAAGGITLAFAVLMRLTVREPERTPEHAQGAGAGRAQVRESIALVWRDPALRHVCCGAIITAAVGYGALAWLPSYLLRSHHMSLSAVGLYLACAVGIGGALGNWLCGRFCDRLGRRDLRWSLWLVAALFIGSKPFSMAFYLTDNTAAALAVFVVPATMGAVFNGPSIAALHDRVPADHRPIVSAIYLLLVNFIGLGLGPLVTGALSQTVFSGYGEDSLRYALVSVQLLGVWGGLHYWLAGRAMAARPA
jgi:predicted MFS family arabinose efflux permease